MAKLAWIGTGVMGRHMAGHLAAAGHELTLYNRSPEKAAATAAAIAAAGGMGRACPSIAAAVADCDAVFVMVGLPSDVAEVFRGPEGIFAWAPRGALAVDMTTSSPELAAELYHEGKECGIRVMDAPVSGGDSGARAGTLSVMVGGDEEDFAGVREWLDCFSSSVTHLGPAGFGQHCKAANQIAVAGATAAMTEALVYAERTGLDPKRMLAAITGGAAGSWQLANMAPRVLTEDFAPGFFVRHFIKDMTIIHDEMARRGTTLTMLEAVLGMYRDFAAAGHEASGTQALIQLYRAEKD